MLSDRGHYGRPYEPFSRPTYQIARRRVVSPPVNPILTPDELKGWLGIDPDDTSQDAILAEAIAAATDEAEAYMRISLITRTIEATYDYFPAAAPAPFGSSMYASSDRSMQTGQGALFAYLYAPPIVQVDKVSWALRSGDIISPWNTSLYQLDNADPKQLGRLVLNIGTMPPSPLREQGGLTIEYQAGYGPDATDVPPAIKMGIRTTAIYLYANRGDCGCASAGGKGPVELSGAAGQLRRYRIERAD